MVVSLIAIKATKCDLKIVFSINFCWRESGGPRAKHCHIVPHQQDPKTLAKVADDLLIQLSNIPGQLPA